MNLKSDRIEKGQWWNDAWSLVEGCTHVSQGCNNCWLETFAARQSRNPNEKIQARYGGITNGVSKWNGTIRFNHGDLDKPFRKAKSSVYSIWSDLFHESVHFTDIALAMGVMWASRRDTFVICTKRPERMAQFFREVSLQECQVQAFNFFGTNWTKWANVRDMGMGEWPLPNVIGMVSVEDQTEAETRLNHLIETPLACRAIAAAPLLGPLDATKWLQTGKIGWLVAECEKVGNRAGRPAEREWFESLCDQAAAYSVPFWLKQMVYCCRINAAPPLNDRQWLEMPEGM
jgi:protein gp37